MIKTKIEIGTPTEVSYRREILPIIRKHPDYLQQDPLPSRNEFESVRINGAVCGFYALRIYGKKLAEVRSLAFSAWWWKLLLSWILVRRCIRRAQQEEIYQLLVTLGKKYRILFWLFGFRRFNNQKFAMLKVAEGLRPLEESDIQGVEIRQGEESDRGAIAKLVSQNPEALIQPGSGMFPQAREFRLALANINGRNIVVSCAALVVFLPKEGGCSELAEIRTVKTRPGFERLGLAKELVTRCINIAIALGVRELLAVTGKKSWFETHFKFSTQRGSEQAWFKVLKTVNKKRKQDAGTAAAKNETERRVITTSASAP